MCHVMRVWTSAQMTGHTCSEPPTQAHRPVSQTRVHEYSEAASGNFKPKSSASS